jgi:colicin import membrane protein
MTPGIQELIEVKPIDTKPVNDYESKAVDLTRSIASLKIADQTTYETAVNYRKSIKKMESEIEAARKSIVDPLNKVKDAVQALFNPVKLRLDNSRRHVEGLIDAYEQAQARKQKEEEERLRKAAEAEESRLRKIKEEQERSWREKEEKARKEAAELEKAGKSEEAAKAKAEADKAAKLADERAQQAAEIQVVAPVIASTIQKVAGTSVQEKWQAEVVDMLALVKAVAEGKAPLEWLTVNQVAINKQAVATKNSLPFPGIKFFSKRIQVDRS